ncbi:thioesterase II family protein [Nocardia sp. NPDC058658]|uniref:thioesterase II family protein n=1 Tax=Nocardia sp. NPDC058658 TaxID=3346580 RepID=UPI00365501AC
MSGYGKGFQPWRLVGTVYNWGICNEDPTMSCARSSWPGMNTPWLRCRAPRSAPRVRLVCFPHAGGAASFFKTWHEELPVDIEVSAVQYPGREDRLVDPHIDRMSQLVHLVAAALVPFLDRPLALFGHSMGAAVAYEVARSLERANATSGAEPLVRLIVSGRHAPSELVIGDVHLRSDDAVVDELVRLGGTDGELLRLPDVASVFLPAIRGDFRLAETYRHAAGSPLACPVTAVIGTEDAEVTAAQAERWGEHTTGEFDLVQLPGDHFYLRDQQQVLLERIRRRLAATATSSPSRNPVSHMGLFGQRV